MKKIIFISALLLAFMSCSSSDDSTDVPGVIVEGEAALVDGNIATCYKAEGSEVVFSIAPTTTNVVNGYSIYSGNESTDADAYTWTMSGSNDEKSWTEIDVQVDASFSARYQENIYELSAPANYKFYQFKVKPTKGTSLVIAEIKFHKEKPNKDWANFVYPAIHFEDEAPTTKGSEYYDLLVQDKTAYLQYHAKEVCKILYFSDSDPIVPIQGIDYTLRDYDGVSAKDGRPPVIGIVYSTRHIESSYLNSLYRLDYETRGVLYHEMTHAYQIEPKGIGDYGNSKVFWSYIEGLADAVRIEAGFTSFSERKRGGDYRDGYKTTGFFLQWLTTKDPDALRKFNYTAHLFDVWSYDKAIKYIFGEEATAMDMWYEYQAELKNGK